MSTDHRKRAAVSTEFSLTSLIRPDSALALRTIISQRRASL